MLMSQASYMHLPQVVAILFYLFCEVFNNNKFVINFVVCVVLLALDFWAVSTRWLCSLLAMWRPYSERTIAALASSHSPEH